MKYCRWLTLVPGPTLQTSSAPDEFENLTTVDLGRATNVGPVNSGPFVVVAASPAAAEYGTTTADTANTRLQHVKPKK